MAQPAAKLSISIPRSWRVRFVVVSSGLSGSLRKRLLTSLSASSWAASGGIEAARGPVSSAEVAKARRAWPKR